MQYRWSGRRWCCGALLGPTALLLASAAATAARADTVAYWRFERGPAGAAAGTVPDSSGNGLTATAVNGPVYRAAVPAAMVPQTGAVNQHSLEFNGSSQRVFVPDYPELALTRSFTIEASVYLHGQSGPSDNIVFRGDDRPGLDAYVLNVIGGSVYIGVTDAADRVATTNAPIAFNTWVHVAAVLDDAAGTLSLYTNGVRRGSVATAIRPLAALDPGASPGVGIGSVQSSGYDQWFDGLIDEVRISDEALVPGQFLNARGPSASLPGDANFDGSVNLADFGILRQNFGLSGAGWGSADFDASGTVDIADFGILRANFGRTDDAAAAAAAAFATIPEPAAAAGLLTLAAAGARLPARRRRW